MTDLIAGILIGAAAGALAAGLALRGKHRRVERRLREAQASEHLAELGAVTGGLAHEIKNPLSTIKLNAQLLQEDLRRVGQGLDADDPIRDDIDRIQRRFDGLVREVQRLTNILDDFLRFAGRMKLDLADVDLNGLVAELADFYAPQAQQAGVRLRLQPAPAPAWVRADAGLLKQALLNLLLNATQAMHACRGGDQPSGGADELILRVERRRVMGREEVHAHVIDTGPGIEAAAVAKVFHPYFSTKKTGTGLGLPTARRILREHGGDVALHSEPGRGTDFTLVLPAAPAPAESGREDAEGG